MFFALRQPGWAMALLVAQLALVVAWFVASWRVSRIAALLVAPLAAWLCFAGFLNAWIAIAN